MNQKNGKIISQIGQLYPNDLGEMDVSRIFEIVDEIEKTSQETAFIPHIFNLFEKYPEADFGSPGPFVHFIEKHYPYYLEILGQSVQRRPSHAAVWMINRILNSNLPASLRNTLMGLLRSAVKNPRTPEPLIREAKGFLEFQTMKEA